MKFRSRVLPSLALITLLGCLGLPPRPTSVKLFDTDSRLVGFVDLLEIKEGVRFRVHTKGMPGGSRGFNVHSAPACDPPAFDSAGSVYNPSSGSRDSVVEGDLPDITVGSTEWADTTFDWASLKLDAGERGLFRNGGTSLVITEQPDASGSPGTSRRIACGVVKPRPEER